MPEKGSAAADSRRARRDLHLQQTKGLFIGASLEGAVISTSAGANTRYYGRPVSTYDILHGRVAAPAGASNLRGALAR